MPHIAAPQGAPGPFTCSALSCNVALILPRKQIYSSESGILASGSIIFFPAFCHKTLGKAGKCFQLHARKVRAVYQLKDLVNYHRGIKISRTQRTSRDAKIFFQKADVNRPSGKPVP